MNQPPKIEPVKLDIPDRIGKKSTVDKSKFDKLPDSKRNIDYRKRLTKELSQAKEPKPKLKEKVMNALLNQLLAFFKTWLYGRPVYKTVTNASGEIEFVLEPVKVFYEATGVWVDKKDENGKVVTKKVLNKPATVLARIMQILGALGLLTATLFGKTVAEWGELLKALVSLIGL